MPFYIPLDKVFDVNEFVQLTKYLSKIRFNKTSIVKRSANRTSRFWPITVETIVELIESFDKGVGKEIVKIFTKKKERDDFSKMLMFLYILDYISYHIPTFMKMQDFHFIILTNHDEYKKYNYAEIGISKLYYESDGDTLEQANEFYAQVKSILVLANFLINLRKNETVSDFTVKAYMRLFKFKHRNNFFENELSERDFNFLKKATVVFRPYDYIEQISNNTTSTSKVNYFIEHLDNDFLTYLNNRGDVATGYCIHNLEAKYESSYLNIWSKINALKKSVVNKEVELKHYFLDIIKMFGTNLSDKLDAFGKGETDNFLYIRMENEFLLNEFKEYLFKNYKLSFTNIEADNIVENYMILSKDSIIYISNDINPRQYAILLNKIEEARIKYSIKIICYSNTIPKTLRHVPFITPNSTIDIDEKMEINTSKLFHAILCKYSPEAIQQIPPIIELIGNNKFDELIIDDKLDYRALDFAINQLRKINFDYLSPTSWYYFQDEYKKHIKIDHYPQNEGYSKSLITIIKHGEYWEVKSDALKIDINTKLVYVNYFCIIYKYCYKARTPIDYTKLQLIHLYMQYENTKEEEEKTSLKNDILIRLQDKNLMYNSDSTSYSSVYKTFIHNHSELEEHLENFLDKESVKKMIQLSDKGKQHYDFEIIGFEIDNFWYEENYKDLLKKMLI